MQQTQVVPITKKPIDPEAKKILGEIIQKQGQWLIEYN